MSKLNPGKIFEQDFRASVPKEVYKLKLNDSAIGFDIKNSKQRFSLKSPYDFILCRSGQMYALELKSIQTTSISFGNEKSSKIKNSQVENLIKAQAAGAVAGLLINFRKYDETFFIDAELFRWFMETSDKSSINADDCRALGIKIPQKKLRTRYRYDITPIFKNKAA